jgi:hypothetical protein
MNSTGYSTRNTTRNATKNSTRTSIRNANWNSARNVTRNITRITSRNATRNAIRTVAMLGTWTITRNISAKCPLVGEVNEVWLFYVPFDKVAEVSETINIVLWLNSRIKASLRYRRFDKFIQGVLR